MRTQLLVTQEWNEYGDVHFTGGVVVCLLRDHQSIVERLSKNRRKKKDFAAS